MPPPASHGPPPRVTREGETWLTRRLLLCRRTRPRASSWPLTGRTCTTRAPVLRPPALPPASGRAVARRAADHEPRGLSLLHGSAGSQCARRGHSPPEPGPTARRDEIGRGHHDHRKLRCHWDWGHQQPLPEPTEGAAPQVVSLSPWQRPQEKGIDMVLALDVVEFILTEICDVAIFVSLDRDLTDPAGPQEPPAVSQAAVSPRGRRPRAVRAVETQDTCRLRLHPSDPPRDLRVGPGRHELHRRRRPVGPTRAAWRAAHGAIVQGTAGTDRAGRPEAALRATGRRRARPRARRKHGGLRAGGARAAP